MIFLSLLPTSLTCLIIPVFVLTLIFVLVLIAAATIAIFHTASTIDRLAHGLVHSACCLFVKLDASRRKTCLSRVDGNDQDMLVNRLGANAVRYGLPMIFRLQEDIQDADTPITKVRLGSLVYGYFWILTKKFDFEASVIGRAIYNEIVRRRRTPRMARPQLRLPIKEIESEALLPFDDRIALVESVYHGYEEATISPPTSPAGSPGRSFSYPVIGSSLSTIPAIEMEREIPSHFREQMLADWSRDATLAAVQAVSKSTSLNGSRSGTIGINKNRLAANGGLTANGNGHAHATRTPSSFASKANLSPSSSLTGNPGAPLSAKLRKSSVRSNASPAGRSPAGKEQAVTSVEQLKLVLSGHLQPPPTMHGLQHTDSSSSSDSLVSYDMTPSEVSLNPAAVGEPVATDGLEASQQLRPSSRDRKLPILGGPLSSHPTHDSSIDHISSGGDGPVKAVPPVPPIPSGLEGRVSKAKTLQDYPATLPRPATSKRSLKSRSGDRGVSSSWGTSSEERLCQRWTSNLS
ncbi:hypothetical protein B0T26DRAFT_785769 [Lasiosphaeria miniovina]|uniref:Uncharacterized protein n=1 Tax=Lasiosphaeria miniovina TaxID=1954250 RepID=A0AA40A5B8_9PEZI|nr:uncharacterized protein B0T26DRAFT_785769 [Lasiosphaeria miniovina]KAK0709542.1 hypothetical protein B0T26DRAFT_785769 [Lasiosphaeria miniovina]